MFIVLYVLLNCLGAPVNGTKIIMQLLSFHKPSLVLNHLKNAREILTSNESRVPVTLTLLWVLSQPSFKDTRVGIQGNRLFTLILLILIKIEIFTKISSRTVSRLAIERCYSCYILIQ